MATSTSAAAEVFSVHEVARVAGVPASEVRAAIDAGGLRTLSGYLPVPDAVACVRRLRTAHAGGERRAMFTTPRTSLRHASPALAASGMLHLGAFAGVLLLTTLGLTTSAANPVSQSATRMVFLAIPGPGGGGGGGGLRQPAPPPRAEMRSAAAVRSPVPPPRPLTTRKPEPAPRPRPAVPQVAALPAPVDPPPPAPRPELQPQVVAPVVTASSDSRDRAGVLNDTPANAESQGSGSGGGVGSGRGTGIGEGEGAGIGPGSGGGTGGGPYRAGSGITAPGLLHEVRPEYTDDGRRRGLEGDVVLEIVVRRDGIVGDVKLVQGLGGGLDRRAIEAVRQWRFSPARRLGTPVDVIVEVAVEFKLR